MNKYLLNYQEKYLKLLEEFDHTPFNPYNDYIEYIRLKFEQYSYNNLYNFLKNTVLEKNLIYKHYFLNHIELKEFYKIAFQLGKYKEIAKNVLDIH